VKVQLKKIPNGRPSLACVRADGSRTWSKLHPFFPLHDLTHFSVESVLGFSEAFFGLVASGWEIDAFAEPGAATRLPAEALVAECIVGLLDLERGTGQVMPAAEFSEALAEALAGQGRGPFRSISDGELAAVRMLRGALAAEWQRLPDGETMELAFPAPQAGVGARQ
jgi:hypothetical protein